MLVAAFTNTFYCRYPTFGCFMLSCRGDGKRALELAAANGFPRVGWTLMCHGALAVPVWVSRDESQVSSQEATAAGRQSALPAQPLPSMLVCHAVQSNESPW
jgi:hypothetical protein